MLIDCTLHQLLLLREPVCQKSLTVATVVVSTQLIIDEGVGLDLCTKMVWICDWGFVEFPKSHIATF